MWKFVELKRNSGAALAGPPPHRTNRYLTIYPESIGERVLQPPGDLLLTLGLVEVRLAVFSVSLRFKPVPPSHVVFYFRTSHGDITLNLAEDKHSNTRSASLV
ncbi:hypothetical protein EYF80_041964 [Liparis tanakae]|uniref:Uncharacterized protein n=1 Tax=Liparis tanakae TaxID=230148 RepID=A0A4Z2G3D8_9TELE|nr:hypothetical protein EYF80_041964 [Liparis tanakae]